MISRYELERQRVLAKQNAEKVHRIDKGQELWTQVFDLVSREGKIIPWSISPEELLRIDFELLRWRSSQPISQTIWYLIEDVDLKEEEPTTVIMKGFGTGEGSKSIKYIQLWAEGAYNVLELSNLPDYEPQKFDRETQHKDIPTFSPAGLADMKLLNLYSHVLERLGAKLGFIPANSK